jgi:hypothetical protein
VARAVSNLGDALRHSLPDREVLGLLFSSLRSAQSFTDRDYVDLAHFCWQLAQVDSQGRIGTAALRVLEQLKDESSPLVAEGHHGPGVDHASGLSIYLPVRVLSPLYSNLLFSRDCAWDDFLNVFVHPS